MNDQVIPEFWGTPKFSFGNQVGLRSLPDPLMWFGVITGVEYALASKIWIYRILIFNHSLLLQESENIKIFVTWLEPNMILVGKE